MERKPIHAIDYVYILVKWRKFILTVCFIVCFIAALISLTLPKVYEASTTILPPTEENQGLKLSGLLSSLSMMGNMVGSGLPEESYMFLAILNSRTMMDTVITKFDLIKKYHAKNIELAEKTLRKKMKVEMMDDGTIKISVKAGTRHFPSDTDADSARILASRMANFIVEELDHVNKTLRNEKAHDYRIFIEKRFQQNLDDLRKAEEDYHHFQKVYGAVDIPQQTLASIQTISELKAQIISKQIEVRSFEKIFNSSHSQTQKAKTELEELERKYRELDSGDTDISANKTISSSKGVLIPYNQIPDLGLKYLRLFRDVKMQETLMEFLLPQYEQAKIEEAKDTPTVQVLDKAIPPIKRIRPKRALFVLGVGFVSFLFCALFVFLIEYIQQTQNDTGKNNKTRLILHELKGDWLSFRGKFKR
jgi:tyrosine-protein kinase Etk/Wzc